MQNGRGAASRFDLSVVSGGSTLLEEINPQVLVRKAAGFIVRPDRNVRVLPPREDPDCVRALPVRLLGGRLSRNKGVIKRPLTVV